MSGVPSYATLSSLVTLCRASSSCCGLPEHLTLSLPFQVMPGSACTSLPVPCPGAILFCLRLLGPFPQPPFAQGLEACLVLHSVLLLHCLRQERKSGPDVPFGPKVEWRSCCFIFKSRFLSQKNCFGFPPSSSRNSFGHMQVLVGNSYLGFIPNLTFPLILYPTFPILSLPP